jgi:ABC-2 type transport system permease protein
LIVPRASMATVLQWVADALPLSYAYDALSVVGGGGGLTVALAVDLAVMVGVALLALGLGATTLRRRSA